MSSNFSNVCSISTEDLANIFKSCKLDDDAAIKNYYISRASDKMLGFLGDYWKLEIQVISGKHKIRRLNFFIKAISKSNTAKANMVREMKLFEKEFTFYTVIKNKINFPNIKPWSANLMTTLDEALVFEDLNALRYRTRNKFETFDEQHTLLALDTLARFHGASLIYEEKKREQLQRFYSIYEDHKEDLNRGGYQKSDSWFTQCMNGALEVMKSYSKYSSDEKALKIIENRWADVWHEALDLSFFSLDHRNVLCHRDLWNNNILFRYRKVDESLIPDDCVLVDFQAVAYQPPAADVMLLLYLNLDPVFLEKNSLNFLNYYYQQLEMNLQCNSVHIADIITREDFLNSCQRYKLWGLIVCACLVPQFWIDDDLITKIFSNTASFEEVLTKDKASFIKKMIENNCDYKTKVMQVFEEIVNNYCLNDIVK